jgi:hypothetical protein
VVVDVYGQFERHRIVYKGDYVVLSPGQSWYLDIAEKVPMKSPAGVYQVKVSVWDTFYQYPKIYSPPVYVTVME